MSQSLPTERRRDKWVVVTTINRPTTAIQTIARLAGKGWSVVVVGDRKTPADWHHPGVEYLSPQAQRERFAPLADLMPWNHYCRKNLGYLHAIAQGAELIVETDDDNIPYDSFGDGISRRLAAAEVGGSEWVNIYRHFTRGTPGANIWPRGLPLDEIHSEGVVGGAEVERDYPVQQYLADGDPDVDAIYRLVFKGELDFDRRAPLGVAPGTWVPFNSQNTLFYADAFPLLYMPCHVNFRMADIWRSFVGQQALWLLGHRLAFLSATVRQVRNQHDLMDDFRDEIIGYTDNRRLVRAMAARAATLSAAQGPVAIGRALWGALHEAGLVPEVELRIVEAWGVQVAQAMAAGRARQAALREVAVPAAVA